MNGIIQAAVGGQAVTQVFEGEKWFDLVVRFLPQYRKDAQTIGDIQVTTPDNSRLPLKQLALIKGSLGAFIIYCVMILVLIVRPQGLFARGTAK